MQISKDIIFLTENELKEIYFSSIKEYVNSDMDRIVEYFSWTNSEKANLILNEMNKIINKTIHEIIEHFQQFNTDLICWLVKKDISIEDFKNKEIICLIDGTTKVLYNYKSDDFMGQHFSETIYQNQINEKENVHSQD